MRTSFLYRALQASIIASSITFTLAQSPASSAAAASSTVELSAITTLGCYSAADPLTKDNTDTFQTPGLCQPACANKGHSVMAVTGGSTCYCGDLIPALDNKVDDSNCNSPCAGYDIQTCGGIGFWQVYLTGLTGDVSRAPNATANSTLSNSSSHGSTSSNTATTSHAAQTVIVTQSAIASPSQAAESGPNKVGIAVGVVVGVIVMAAVAGGAIVFYKQRRRREIEEEHKQQAAINSFVSSRNSDTKSDARLDPSVASSYRRESIGSIADERDFSRRILQVRPTGLTGE